MRSRCGSGGRRLEGIKMEILAFQHDYMIATCASNIDAKFEPFKELDIESDVYTSTWFRPHLLLNSALANYP